MRRRGDSASGLSNSFIDLFASSLGAIIFFLIVMFLIASVKSQDATETGKKLKDATNERDKHKSEGAQCNRDKNLARADNRKQKRRILGLLADMNLFRDRSQKAAKALEDFKSKVVLVVERPVDILFILDATSSMLDDIDAIKKRIRHIIQVARYLSDKTRVGFVIFRDRYNTSVTEKQELTANADTIVQFLSGITAQSSPANRDYAEAVYQGLETGIRRINWANDSTRLVIVISDAEAYEEKRSLALKLISEFAADERNTVSCICIDEPRRLATDFDTKVASFYRQAAKAGRGDFIRLDAPIKLFKSILKLIWSKRTASLKQVLNTNQPAGI